MSVQAVFAGHPALRRRDLRRNSLTAIPGGRWRLPGWLRIWRLLLMTIALQACNAPPLYETRAEEYLAKRGVPSALITRLAERSPVSAKEAEALARYDDSAVLHLLASNPSLPAALILSLAKHPDEEVRWGIAYNPSAPLATLSSLRMPGRYSTMNEYLARNPRVPAAMLMEMYRSGEANKVSFGMNPACPREIMDEIATNGTDLDRTWLAANPGLPPELIAVLVRDPSPDVQRFLAQNPAFRNWKAAGAAQRKANAQ